MYALIMRRDRVIDENMGVRYIAMYGVIIIAGGW